MPEYMRYLETMYAVDLRERAFIGSNGEGKVEEVRRVGEIGDHGRGKVELSQILWENKSENFADPPEMNSMHTFLHSNLGSTGLGLPLRRRLLILLHAPNLIRAH